MKFLGLLVLSCLAIPLSFAEDRSSNWPQFRGPNASGRQPKELPLPTEISPAKGVLWKIDLPPGHSSPVVFGDRIFLTAVEGDELLTIALERSTGKILWKKSAPHETLEAIHQIGSHTQCTPATDGEIVVVFFGSSGILCYDIEGNLKWSHRMGPFKNDFGAGSSPIIIDDLVILCQDHDSDSFLIAYDKKTGDQKYRINRSEFSRNYCTPVIMEVEGQKQIVLAATLRVVGYDLKTGQESWTVRGLSRVVCMTPSIGENGLLYVAGWSAGGEPGERISLEPFDDYAVPLDKNENGSLEAEEVQEPSPLKPRFTQADRDKDGSVSRIEYEEFRMLFEKSRNIVMAIKPGGKGEATKTHVVWEQPKLVPFCASPIAYRGFVFTVKDGGIVSCLEGETGKALKQFRLNVAGNYYSSPVAGDGKIYFASEEGKVTVIKADPSCEVLSTSDFGEPIYATPVPLDGQIFLRTSRHLYCFGG